MKLLRNREIETKMSTLTNMDLKRKEKKMQKKGGISVLEWMRDSGIQYTSRGAHFALLPIKKKTKIKSE